MAITYPISLPTENGMSRILFGAENVAAISSSPFTFSQQVVKHPGERWTASVSLPPMKRDLAENWVAALLSLRGAYGTFLLGDPLGTSPQGDAVRRNYHSRTNDFTNAAWTKTRSSVSVNGLTNPADGTSSTVFNLIEDSSASNTHTMGHSISFTAGQYVTASIYIHNTSIRRLAFRFYSGAFGGTYQTVAFDATALTFTNISGTAETGYESVGSGWYRIWARVLPTVTTSTTFEYALVITNNTSYTGDGTSYAVIASPQVEYNTVATDYQKVEASFTTPLVNGASQVGESLNIDGLNYSTNGVFLAGDYIQLGSGSSATLHKILTTVNSNSSGQATLDIWPRIRSAPADNAAVTITNCKGKFRLSSSVQSWEINNISSYGITFDCVEAV